MANDRSLDLTKVDFKKGVLSEGFTNDETPLDEYNMNQLAGGIQKNHQSIETITNELDGLKTNSVSKSTFDEMMNHLEDRNVKEIEPTLNVNVDYGGSYELGSNITLKFTTFFNDGQYKYGCIDTNNGTKYNKDAPTGVTLTNYEVTFNGETITGTSTSATYTSFKAYNVSSTEPKSVTGVFNCQNNSNKTPVSNLGRTISDSKYGNKTNAPATISGNSTVSGYRMGCFAGTYPHDVTVSSIDSSAIRYFGGTKERGYRSNKAYTSGAFELQIPVGAKSILIACPATKTGPIDILNTTVNAPMTNLFVKVKTVNVMGAGSELGEDYNVWMYKPTVAYTTPATLRITLG